MATKNNLKPVRTKEEARNRGRNGGKKSGEARQKKKLMREALEKLIGNSLDAVTQALIDKAVSGDVRAYEAIRDTLGEKPTDKVEVMGHIDQNEADSFENEILFPEKKKTGGS